MVYCNSGSSSRMCICVMSPWFFNLFMDGVMKEFKANILQGGVKFDMGGNSDRVSGLLFANDTTFIAESESNVQRYVGAFVRVCERRKLKNGGNSKVVKMLDTDERDNLRIKVKEEVMEEGGFCCGCFNLLRSEI